MIIRFVFVSDSIQNNHEGWMIDNIRLYSVDIGGAVNEFSKDNNIHISPNPFISNTEISFEKVFHTIMLEVIDNQGSVIDKAVFSDCNKISYYRNNLSKGFYLFKFTLDKNIVVTKKVIVNQ